MTTDIELGEQYYNFFTGNTSTVRGNRELEVEQLLMASRFTEKDTNRKGVQIDVDEMCRILKINPQAKQEDVKKQFRAVMRDFHPDVLQSKGIDPEKIRELGWRLSQLKEKLGA